MKKSWISWIGFFTIVFVLFSFTACDSGSDGEDIPDDVAQIGSGSFYVIQRVINYATDTSSYEPDGMDIYATNAGGTAYLTNYQPFPYDDPITVTGTISVTVTSTDPLTMTIIANCTFGDSEFKTLSISAKAKWAEGEGLETYPSSYSGTIKIDDKEYSVDDMLDAIEELEDDE